MSKASRSGLEGLCQGGGVVWSRIVRVDCSMKKAPDPENEIQRLAALHALNILDTPREERFDRVTRIAQALFDVPIVAVSLVDENREWFKSCLGVSGSEGSRSSSFCGHAILQDQILIIPDTLWGLSEK